MPLLQNQTTQLAQGLINIFQELYGEDGGYYLESLLGRLEVSEEQADLGIKGEVCLQFPDANLENLAKIEFNLDARYSRYKINYYHYIRESKELLEILYNEAFTLEQKEERVRAAAPRIKHYKDKMGIALESKLEHYKYSLYEELKKSFLPEGIHDRYLRIAAIVVAEHLCVDGKFDNNERDLARQRAARELVQRALDVYNNRATVKDHPDQIWEYKDVDGNEDYDQLHKIIMPMIIELEKTEKVKVLAPRADDGSYKGIEIGIEQNILDKINELQNLEHHIDNPRGPNEVKNFINTKAEYCRILYQQLVAQRMYSDSENKPSYIELAKVSIIVYKYLKYSDNLAAKKPIDLAAIAFAAIEGKVEILNQPGNIWDYTKPDGSPASSVEKMVIAMIMDHEEPRELTIFANRNIDTNKYKGLKLNYEQSLLNRINALNELSLEDLPPILNDNQILYEKTASDKLYNAFIQALAKTYSHDSRLHENNDAYPKYQRNSDTVIEPVYIPGFNYKGAASVEEFWNLLGLNNLDRRVIDLFQHRINQHPEYFSEFIYNFAEEINNSIYPPLPEPFEVVNQPQNFIQRILGTEPKKELNINEILSQRIKTHCDVARDERVLEEDFGEDRIIEDGNYANHHNGYGIGPTSSHNRQAGLDSEQSSTIDSSSFAPSKPKSKMDTKRTAIGGGIAIVGILIGIGCFAAISLAYSISVVAIIGLVLGGLVIAGGGIAIGGYVARPREDKKEVAEYKSKHTQFSQEVSKGQREFNPVIQQFLNRSNARQGQSAAI